MTNVLSISLEKDQRVPLTLNLEKGGQAIDQAEIGAGWSPQTDKSSYPFDVDLMSLRYDADGLPRSFDDIMYFNHENAKRAGRNQPFSSLDGTFHHSGDNETGEGEGLDEVLTAMLAAQPEWVRKIDVLVNLDKAITRGQTFDLVDDCFAQVTDPAGLVNIRYNLTQQGAGFTAFQLITIHLDPSGSREVEAVGKGFGHIEFDGAGNVIKDKSRSGIVEYFALRGIQVEEPFSS